MINEIIPAASFMLILVVLSLMVLGMVGIRPAKKDYFEKTGWAAKLIVLILIIIFLGVVDMSLESVEIPVIHDVAGGFVDGGDSGDGGDSSSSSGGGSGLSNEQISIIINFAIVLALMVGLPLATIYFIVKAK